MPKIIVTDEDEKEYKRRIAASEDGLVEAIGKELLEVHLGVDGQKQQSMPIRNNCVKV